MTKIKIIIAKLTRNRPIMLSNLYRSFSSLELPSSIDVRFLVVENNHIGTCDGWFAKVSANICFAPVYYLLERSIGISSARNRALDHAVQADADFLVFVDDDELVEPDWLTQLLIEQQRMNLDIVGSPVRPRPLRADLNFWQRAVWSGVERSSIKAERRLHERWQNNRADTIKLATGSWMGKLEFFRQTGLRFDPQLNLTGGEDWDLWNRAKKLGAKTGWAPKAIVYEAVPYSRLTLSYHFSRNRDHNATEFARIYRENPWRALRRLPLKILARSLKLLWAICVMPFIGGYALISFVAALGGVIGLLQACCGKRPMHYEKISGF